MDSAVVSEPVPIAFCITDLDRGGAELALVALVTRLDPERWAPHVFCLTHRGRLAETLEEAGIPVTCLHLQRWNLPAVLWRLRRGLRHVRPQVVQTFLYHANILGRLAARMAGVSCVVSGVRVAEQRSRLRLLIDRWTQFLVRKHVCVSEGVARFSIDRGGLPRPKVVVIPNGVDYEKFAGATPTDLEGLGVPAGSVTILFVGRLEHQKAPEVLVAAVAPLLQADRKRHVLLVGSGPDEARLREQAARLAVADQLHFAGRRDDVAGLMAAADCLVLPSRWEGMPNVVLEAMAAGLPVVATAVEGIDELLGRGNCGRIVPVDHPIALAEALNEFLQTREERKRIGLAAQLYVREHFTWNAVAAAYSDLYAELLEPDGSGKNL